MDLTKESKGSSHPYATMMVKEISSKTHVFVFLPVSDSDTLTTFLMLLSLTAVIRPGSSVAVDVLGSV